MGLIAKQKPGAWIFFWGLFGLSNLAAQPDLGRLVMTVTEEKKNEPLPCRIHFRNPKGKAVRAERLPFFHDHFVCAGQVQLDLSPGN